MADSERIRLAVVGGDAERRLALRAGLEGTGRFEVVADVDATDQVIDLVESTHPDQLVLETNETFDATVETLTALHRTSPHTRVLLYAEEVDHNAPAIARRLGADRVLQRGAGIPEVTATLLDLDRAARRDARVRANLPTDNGLVVLYEDECLALLASAPLGRVAVTVGALPAVFPVNFTLVDRRILFFTSEGTKLAAATRNAIVAFEADDFDVVDRSGWSVLAVGPATEVVDHDLNERARRAMVDAWAEGDRSHLVQIDAEVITGRLVPGTRGRWTT